MALGWSTHRDDDDGILSVRLENDLLRVTVLPELGGKIWSILYQPQQREMLWHHPSLTPQPASLGAPYDDLFCGGWDELFPSDAPTEIDGFVLPDHGEWWSIPWNWQVAETRETLTLTLEASGFATPHQAKRTLTLREGQAAIELGTAIHNTGDRSIPYLWRHHPAFPVAAGTRLHLPPAQVIIDAEFTSQIAGRPFTWPNARSTAGEAVDLSTLPAADSGQTWMLYLTDLSAGRCVLNYPNEGIAIGLSFDAAIVDTLTLFATFGGWRDLATILPEPGVGYPADLAQARAVGRQATLLPGETVEYRATVAVVTENALGRA